MLEPIELPQDYTVLLLLPAGAVKRSTADVYAAFDARDGATGYAEREAALRARPRIRSRGAPAERPRELAARRATPRRGSVPCRRQRCRPDRVRALRNDRRRGACRGRVARPRRDVDFETSVVPLISMFGSHAIEHGSTRTGRWLRERRFRFTLWIATVEGLLYVLARAPLVGRGPARAHRRRVLVVRRTRQPLRHPAGGGLDLRSLATARSVRAAGARRSQGGRDRRDRPARDRSADLPVHRTAEISCLRSMGRSQAVRQRVLVPRSQVRILAPQ